MLNILNLLLFLNERQKKNPLTPNCCDDKKRGQSDNLSKSDRKLKLENEKKRNKRNRIEKKRNVDEKYNNLN